MWSHAVSCVWWLKNLGVLVPVSMCFYSDYSLERKGGRQALPQPPCECSAESVPQTPTCSPQHQTWCCCSRNGEVVDFWGQFICYRSTDWHYRKIQTILLVRWKPGWVISVLWASCLVPLNAAERLVPASRALLLLKRVPGLLSAGSAVGCLLGREHLLCVLLLAHVVLSCFTVRAPLLAVQLREGGREHLQKFTWDMSQFCDLESH